MDSEIMIIYAKNDDLFFLILIKFIINKALFDQSLDEYLQ
jgi:hypothetical protein